MTFRHKTLLRVWFLSYSLEKENQLVITEKDEFDYRDQSIVLPISSLPKIWDFLKEVFDIFSTTENFLLVGNF